MLDQQQQEQKDTEIVLGTGKLLAIFFGLVAICGTFFGLGYSVGHSASPMAIQTENSGMVTSSPGVKHDAGVTVAAPQPVVTPAPAANNPNTAANSQVDQVPPQNVDATAADSSTPTNNDSASVLKQASATTVTPTPVTSDSAPAPGAITVQVAAVTKQEDAQALVAALRKKNYPVFVSPNPSGDNLYHVQVGPFAEVKDAEAMKSKLAGDGYNAIVKK